MSEKSSFDASKAVDQVKRDRNLMAAVLGALGVVVGVFLPWYSIDVFGLSTSVSPGLNGTGFLLIVCSAVVIAALLNVFNQDRKMMGVVAIVAGLLAVLIMLNNWPDSELGEFVSTGIGYWLGLVGSTVMTVGAVMARIAMQGSSKPAPKADESDKKE